ncbi:hypothetical protein DF122_17925 [Burkholderia pseudomallei]|nr:hypothetical protein BOC35_17790 [Burkholderia pseudomallei]ARK65064.1 hypothetical protein BOC37_21310 [Burkholderia pseudomallei]ARK78606.1 hypothetical protein BOC39_36350 [Burkholderia pseudomallei]ARK82751.1 hypothetical protein BOC40_07940 [Burkholderia pseudomallei]ARK90018.1 hypothetical protein BOC42_19665 [Burkholderia pseudomallei]
MFFERRLYDMGNSIIDWLTVGLLGTLHRRDPAQVGKNAVSVRECPIYYSSSIRSMCISIDRSTTIRSLI